jgi:CDP-diacylglycerol--glycerol-3-phosphate 3-phosphatidyltransferase
VRRAPRRSPRRKLTFRRLSGLDRSGPPPPQTQRGQPWHLWTLPNAIGLLRFALLPIFLVIELSSDTGVEAAGAIIYAVAAWTDYADGIAARITGQYSRFGALMDPIVDRLLVICGVVVCWYHDLLPRWALAVLIARELFMLLAGQYVIRQGRELKINMVGRWAVWPVMSAIFLALCGVDTVADVLLYIGLVLTLWATVLYVRDARPSTSA